MFTCTMFLRKATWVFFKYEWRCIGHVHLIFCSHGFVFVVTCVFFILLDLSAELKKQALLALRESVMEKFQFPWLTYITLVSLQHNADIN